MIGCVQRVCVRCGWPLTMAKTSAICAIIALLGCGCSSDEKVDERDGGGGNAGQDSGLAGTWGGNTDASTGGTSSGGSAGTAASSGVSGDAGTGDAADASDWPDVACKEQSITSNCSFATTCAQVNCGDKSSQIDENGCRRPKCLKDAECAADERCLPSSLATSNCLPTALTFCQLWQGKCGCTTSADCGGHINCVPQGLAPKEADCTLDPNPSCALLAVHLDSAANQAARPGLATELVQQVNNCKTKVEAEIAAKGCP